MLLNKQQISKNMATADKGDVSRKKLLKNE